MKTFLLSIGLAVIACAASAQTFVGGVTIIGTTNAPVVVNGQVPTNSISFFFPGKTLTLSNIPTNETAILSYGFQLPGLTNFIPLVSITNYGTNGSTWTTNIPPTTYSFPLVPYAQAAIGSTNTNSIYLP